ncbi:MAG TPA: helix-turn-helix transcriptional regulator [Pseudonocardia sp.]
MASGDAKLGALIAEFRRSKGLSLAELAGQTYVSRGWINNVEAGRRWPAREWVDQVEIVLDAGGLLLPAWDRANQERGSDAELRQLLKDSERESELLIAAQPDAVELDRIGESAAKLAVAYLASPARPMLEQARALRGELTRRITSGAVRPGQLADLYVTLGRVCGIVTYAALDLGSPESAHTHAKAAWRTADFAGDNELRAWVRGTQSLVARFEKRYILAEAFVEDGFQFAGSGTSEIRLLCGAAQCAANLGDGESALTYIERARRARESAGPDSLEGLFGFSPAKQSYYSASSLMWLPDEPALQVAEASALDAIATWEHEPVEQRSLDDEALAHVYLATARLKLGEIEGAMESVRPIMDLPEERQISWIRKRIADLADLLDGDRYHGSIPASDARDELRAFGA